MCLAKIADPLGLTQNRIGDPLQLTKKAIGDPLDVLGNREGERKRQFESDMRADAEAAAAQAKANAPRQARKQPVAGVDSSAGGGGVGYSTLLTGLSGIEPGQLTLGGGATLLGA